MKIAITEGADYNKEAIAVYQQIGNTEIYDFQKELDFSKLKNTNALVIRLGHKITEEVLNQLLNLKYIISPTTGTDHIDMAMAQERGITVLTLKGEQTFLDQIPSTAEHTWALLLAVQRKLIQAVQHTQQGQWNRNLFKGYNLKGKTIGIIGMGRVGKQVAQFANCFGMSIHYYDPFLTSDKIIGLIGTCESNIDHLFKYSDIISIHIPLNDTTKGIINGRLMNLMPKNSIIINTSRGEIWDENALAKSIKQNKIAGAATDVLSNEFDQTEINKNPLILLQSKGFPIIITPHIAGATFDSMHATELYMAQKFNNTLNG